MIENEPESIWAACQLRTELLGAPKLCKRLVRRVKCRVVAPHLKAGLAIRYRELKPRLITAKRSGSSVVNGFMVLDAVNKRHLLRINSHPPRH